MNAPRLATRFSWHAVERSLTRLLLTAVYDADGDVSSVAALRDRSDDRLPALAERALGSPPAMRHMDVLLDPLRDSWLSDLGAPALDDLVNAIQHDLTGQARDERLRTKRERLEFIGHRRRTHNLKVHVRRAFVSMHRLSLPATSSSGPTESADRALWLLLGAGQSEDRKPYPHQIEAWVNLDLIVAERNSADRGGLLVLPTGAGKTYTVVRWVLERMASDQRLQVLWIADLQELVEQAAATFMKVAASSAIGFERTLRRIYGGASPATTLADENLDIAVCTRQSLRGDMNEATKKRIRRFLGDRPTVVVVDEAHHAVAPSYEDLLDFIQAHSEPILVGLTATPWPSGYGATVRLRRRFPRTIADADVGELIRSGVLARPVHHSVDTGERIDLTDDERKAVGGRDLPASLLRRLDSERRNHLVVESWMQRRAEWGKTLVFAVDIDHAERLHTLFQERGAAVAVLHSRSETSRIDVLDGFRDATGPTVLVSVGMLTEGVDLPDARTAFLARPTMSRILLRQMIGRVLRGPLGGGDAIAHIVDVRDQWDDDVDVLMPIEIPMGGELEPLPDAGGQSHRLPPIVDELTGNPIPEEVLHRILRSYRERIVGEAGQVIMTSAMLVGFYRLDDLCPPVFDHTRERYRMLIEAVAAGHPLPVRSPIDLFDDLPVPRPMRRDVEAIIEFVRSQGVDPPFEPLHADFSVRSIARELWNRTMTPAEQSSWLQERYESSLARSMFLGFQAFYEAVHQELFSLGLPEGHTGLNPENPRTQPAQAKPQTALRRSSDRDLQVLLSQVKATARDLLDGEDPHYLDLLATPVEVDWTTSSIPGAYAYWTPRISGRRRGHPRIRVNRLLCAPRTQIPDEMLEYLLWHELVHHLLPGQGHDAEFRRLEAIWPDSEKHDHFLDTLGERYDIGTP